ATAHGGGDEARALASRWLPEVPVPAAEIGSLRLLIRSELYAAEWIQSDGLDSRPAGASSRLPAATTISSPGSWDGGYPSVNPMSGSFALAASIRCRNGSVHRTTLSRTCTDM